MTDYTICHHNWQYPFLFPSDDEVVKGYQTLYGPEERDSDAGSEFSDGDESQPGSDAEDEGEGGAEGGAE